MERARDQGLGPAFLHGMERPWLGGHFERDELMDFAAGLGANEDVHLSSSMAITTEWSCQATWRRV